MSRIKVGEIIGPSEAVAAELTGNGEGISKATNNHFLLVFKQESENYFRDCSGVLRCI